MAPFALHRPVPPAHLAEPGDTFAPAPDLATFLHDAFIAPGAPFHRQEYEHLAEARIGVLWTNAIRVKNGLQTLGMAQLWRDSGDKWSSGRSAQQVREWFAGWWDDPYPDFLLTFYAPFAAEANDPSACALFSHELRHCGQDTDAYGEPKYDDSGNPVFAMVGHDVEQFVSVVEDFGIEAAGQRAVEFVRAAQRAPRFSAGEVAGVCGCGTTLRMVA